MVFDEPIQCEKLSVSDDICTPSSECSKNQKTGEEILDLFRMINTENTTVIMITHDIDIAAKADRIIRIKDGELS